MVHVNRGSGLSEADQLLASARKTASDILEAARLEAAVLLQQVSDLKYAAARDAEALAAARKAADDIVEAARIEAAAIRKEIVEGAQAHSIAEQEFHDMSLFSTEVPVAERAHQNDTTESLEGDGHATALEVDTNSTPTCSGYLLSPVTVIATAAAYELLSPRMSTKEDILQERTDLNATTESPSSLDYATRFQDAFSTPACQGWLDLAQTCQDFDIQALHACRTLALELHMPHAQKMLKPNRVLGGHA